MVAFTANRCPYALAWHDRIQHIARDYAGQHVTVLHDGVQIFGYGCPPMAAMVIPARAWAVTLGS